jgi:hypothetical protein
LGLASKQLPVLKPLVIEWLFSNRQHLKLDRLARVNRLFLWLFDDLGRFIDAQEGSRTGGLTRTIVHNNPVNCLIRFDN